MQTVPSAAYFEAQLLEESAHLNNPIVNQLISDMVIYAQSVEKDKKVIPPAASLPSRPRPEELESIQFRGRISQLENSMSETLFSLFQSFLTYIEELEKIER